MGKLEDQNNTITVKKFYTMENQLVVVLPSEVAEIAKNVSVEKRNEVQTVLN